MRLDPMNPTPYLSILGKIQLAKGDVTDAVSSLENVIKPSPDNRLTWMSLISAYGSTNQIEKAKAAIVALNELQNRDQLVSFTVGYAREHWPFQSDNDMNKFLDGLRKAGVPEW